MNKSAFRDLRKAETVNSLTPGQIKSAIRPRFGAVDPRLYEDFDRGMVLSDARGQGYLQRVGE